MSIRNAKAKGRRNEWRSMRLLEASGYSCMRAAASLGAFDIVGFGAHDIVLVQCKSNAWPGTAEMERLRLFVAPPYAKRLVHKWVDRKRLPDVREIA